MKVSVLSYSVASAIPRHRLSAQSYSGYWLAHDVHCSSFANLYIFPVTTTLGSNRTTRTERPKLHWFRAWDRPMERYRTVNNTARNRPNLIGVLSGTLIRTTGCWGCFWMIFYHERQLYHDN